MIILLIIASIIVFFIVCSLIQKMKENICDGHEYPQQCSYFTYERGGGIDPDFYVTSQTWVCKKCGKHKDFVRKPGTLDTLIEKG